MRLTTRVPMIPKLRTGGNQTVNPNVPAPTSTDQTYAPKPVPAGFKYLGGDRYLNPNGQQRTFDQLSQHSTYRNAARSNSLIPRATTPPQPANQETPGFAEYLTSQGFTRKNGQWFNPQGQARTKEQILAHSVGQQYLKNHPEVSTTAPTDTTTTDTPTDTTQTPTDQPSAPTDPTATDSNPSLPFKTVEDFMPKDITSTMAYQTRLKQGQDALNSKLAALGLSNSRADIEATQKLTQDLSAEEQDRAQAIAQQNADRYDALRAGDANRALTHESNAYDTILKAIQMANEMNPTPEGTKATDKISTIKTNIATNKGNKIRTKTRAKNVSGGRVNMPQRPYQPLDTSGVDTLKTYNDVANSNSTSSAVANALANILNLKF